ncbi:MAG: hypothetical protein QME94_05980, partial [Anaerolineae bacterium]|nr:hypothetical protein [Anaerolineae bacterium]
TPTATPTGNTEIYPDQTATADPDTTVAYVHTVVHLDRRTFDYKNITAVSSLGWPVALFEADGVTPLTDHNADGIPDTGKMWDDTPVTIVVKVTVPPGTPGGTADMLVVTAQSGRNPLPQNADTATDTTIVSGAPTLSISVSASAVTFGAVGPDGEVDPGVSGVSSTVDDQGADYVIDAADGQGAAEVTVTSSVPWTGYCRASENAGTATSVTIADQRLAWRLDGAAGWTAFTTAVESPPYGNNCFPSRIVGSNTYLYDYRLRILWSDAAGTFESVVTYEVSQ